MHILDGLRLVLAISFTSILCWSTGYMLAEITRLVVPRLDHWITIKLEGVIRALHLDRRADTRRNSPFVAFIARAKEHAEFFGPGFSQAHHAVIAI